MKKAIRARQFMYTQDLDHLPFKKEDLKSIPKEKQKASGFLGKSGIPSSKRSTTFWGIPWQRRAERKGTREDLPPLLQETVRKTKPSSCA